MTKVKQTQEELEAHLKEQLHFLKVSAERFDEGDESEAKRMSVHIRTLVHDTSQSESLLNLLGIKDKISFIDSSSSRPNTLGPYTGLVLKGVGPKGGKFVAPLDEVPPDQHFRKIPFNDYWEMDIYVDNKGNRFSRKKLVLSVANKDGGAHIDSELDQDYAELTKENSLGWNYGNSLESGPLEQVSAAAIRQITHEILKTLVPDYPEQKRLNSATSMMFGDIWIEEGAPGGYMVGPAPIKNSVPKVGRNDKCPCGSGMKYKKCHGK